MNSIAKKVTFGVLWTTFGNLSIRLLGTISVILLARVLTPEDYGIVAKAVLVHSFLELVTQLGVEAALIQNQKADSEDYNTAWTIKILRGLFVSLILISIAPFVSIYFQEPQLDQIIHVYAVATFVAGFVNIGTVNFRKEYKFNLDFRFRLINKIVSFTVTILIAYLYQSFWAFPFGVLAGSVTALGTSFIWSSYRPFFSLKRWNAFFHFSKWMLLIEIFGAMSSKVDGFILGRFDTSRNLGIYTLSVLISQTATTEVAMPVGRAAFPVLSELQEDKKGSQNANNIILCVILLLITPLALGVSSVSHRLEVIFLGAQWDGAAEIISILSFFSITTAISSFTVPILLSCGRQKTLAKLSATRFFIRAGLLYTGFSTGGIMGLCIAVLVAGILYSMILLTILNRLELISVFRILINSARFGFASIMMFLAVTYLNLFGQEGTLDDQIFYLVGEVIYGALIFFISLFALHKIFPTETAPENILIRKIVLPALHKRKRLAKR